MKKTIITVVGEDTVGIIAKVCTYLAENKINILNISQTIVDGYFNMMMITDTSMSAKKTQCDFRRTGRDWKWNRRGDSCAVRRHFHKNAPDLRSRQKGRKITYD